MLKLGKARPLAPRSSLLAANTACRTGPFGVAKQTTSGHKPPRQFLRKSQGRSVVPSDKSSRIAAAILGFFIATGLAVGGYFISNTIYRGKLASNTVTVKGFAERDVKADLALWTISYSVTGGNLPELYSQSGKNEETLLSFLTQKGFKKDSINSGDLQVNDLLANQFRQNGVSEANRYILRNTLTVRSTDVGLVDQSTHTLNDLVRQGIVLTQNRVDFQFTKLNDIKAAMLRDATQNARTAAQQFANDAGSNVGSIENANQGLFSIVSRDSAAAQDPNGGPVFGQQQSTVDKIVRVVVTLTYYLDK
ncbi:MAG: SIMPL domain-containing protein [Alphaproteobacteria bacterium]|nr:SIMPL domain-containing protein [Alphaproteobacteria bacterium]